MKKLVNLFYLADPIVGGWVTFLGHLAAGFRANGIDVAVFKIRNRTENRTRPFKTGDAYRNIDMETALSLAKSHSLLVAVGPKYWPQALELIRKGATPVIHDPTEFHAETVKQLQGKSVVAIRPIIADTLNQRGVKATFIPHPYTRHKRSTVERDLQSVATSRVDWDKHTEIIVQANLLLPKHQQIKIGGAHNRLFVFHKLDTLDPDWRRNYLGPFEHNGGFRLASQARFVIDMSVIKGDGGGSQYTFLEAWDAGAVLIANKGWATGRKDDVVTPKTAILLSTPEELVDVVRGSPPSYEILTTNGRKQLARHEASKVANQYWELLQK